MANKLSKRTGFLEAPFVNLANILLEKAGYDSLPPETK